MMASTCGPEMPFDLSLRVGQAFDHPTGGQFFEPTDLAAARFQTTESTSCRADAPPPNPPFTFPAKPTSSAGPGSGSSSRSRPAGRRPMSAVEPSSFRRTQGPTAADLEPRPRTTPLPAFSFNPGAGLKPDPTDPLDDPPSPPSPGASQPPAISLSPSRPPGNRHRRGGSEFVGGSIRMGDSITVMSSSPTKSDGGFASSLGLPPASRRLHMRNKSANPTMGGSMDGAMPLQMVDGNIAPRVTATAGTSTATATSAPPSPAGIEPDENSPPVGSTRTANKAEPRPSLTWLSEASWPESASPAESAVEPAVEKPATKAKVGFSDTLEYIPRPLSIVSSDASSTTTLGPRHSLSGSISSIMSASNMSTLEERTATPTPSPAATPERSESRPSTAGAVLDRVISQRDDAAIDSSLKRRNSIPTIVTLTAAGLATTPAEHSPSKVPKRWAFFGLDPFVGTGSPTRSRPTSSGSIGSNPKTWSTSASSSCSVHVPDPELREADVDANQVPAASSASVRAGKEPRKKKKRAKKWAGSILTKKSKPRGHKKASAGVSAVAAATATPPMGRSIPIPSTGDNEADGAVDLISETAVDPDDDDDLPMPPILTVTGPTSSPDDVEISRPVSAPCADDDVSYQMIDLDAALGPFNTPLPRNPEWDAAQKAATHAKRKLHSAQGMKGFSGPGMHYHRRTESAPEMVPFEALRNGLHRFASSSTMADVFEEDEEDESAPKEENSSLAVPAGPAAQSPPMSAANSILSPESEPESDGGDITPAVTVHTAAPSPDRPESTNSPAPESPPEPARALPVPTVKKERSTASLRAEIAELASTIVFRTSNLFADKGSDPDVAVSRSRKLKNRSSRELLANVDISPLQIPSIHHQTPTSPYPTSRASSFPSPRSPASYDAHIISTAPSSVNEDTNFQSLLLGEPGPEVRISVDDIPSLTSSHSTMTRDSFFGNNQAGFDTAASSRQRPLSLSSGPFGRRRSSLASLSRLISSSHGEPSKLSIEVTCENEEEPKKTSRTKRLSRLVQFWKPKEAKNGSGNGNGSATK